MFINESEILQPQDWSFPIPIAYGPGRIAEIIEVKFERPRDISIQTSREFNIIIEQVRDTLGSH